MKIYITRHSKTLWNEEKRLQGRKDSPLTQVGLENIYALKSYLKEEKFDYIFSSPIYRAYHTAQILFDHQVICDDRLSEMNFGIFEGQKICDIIADDKEKLYFRLWHEPQHFTCIPQGETYDEVIERAKSFIDDLKKYPSDSRVFIVTHGMFFIVLLATMLGLEKKDFVLLNQSVVEGCSLTCLDYSNDQFTLEYYNHNSFLPHVSNNTFAK